MPITKGLPKVWSVTLDDLRLFVAACDAGSLSAAARRHGTSQPAVSQHVRRLERELDVALLERGPPGAASSTSCAGAPVARCGWRPAGRRSATS
jgi:hypothetical protein